MNLTKTQIKALKGECPKCFGTKKTPARRMDCRECKGTGQSSIEIKKEWVECELCLRGIPKYKVGEIIDKVVDCDCTNWKKELGKKHGKYISLKIISETEDKWRVTLV